MEINIPQYNFKTRNNDGDIQIFDEIRRKYVALTPEELVRQNLAKFLITEKKYPAPLISIEGSLDINGLNRRYDMLVFENSGNPLMIIECKAPSIKISQKTFDQIAVYNIKTMVDYLLVTNGIDFYICKIDFIDKTYEFLEEIPDYFSIIPNGSK
ncbi:MAG: type I restriction enzyme HsdR N-terminal domain-containing protein [Bacteroidales bacterium]|nr:type I restriction enzyme HsdR N-terminal domain-containing protein [Bacteroidales bacterium]